MAPATAPQQLILPKLRITPRSAPKLKDQSAAGLGSSRMSAFPPRGPRPAMTALRRLRTDIPIWGEGSQRPFDRPTKQSHPADTLDEGTEAGPGAMLPRRRLAGLSALGAYYAGVRVGAQCGPTRSPTRPPPASCPELSLLADPAGRISSNTPRAAPQRPRAQKARPSASYKRPNAATGAATTTSSFHQNSYHICYYRSIGGIFLTEGFQALIRLPEVPPAPLRGAWARFSLG